MKKLLVVIISLMFIVGCGSGLPDAKKHKEQPRQYVAVTIDENK